MDFRTDPLWIRIDAYQIDDPEAYIPLSSKLAKEQGWSVEFTQRAFLEYKKFIYLCCILPGGASPSKIVDEVWHLHLTYTRDYWRRFCKETLQKDIHHHPSKGGPDEQLKHEIWYEETLKQYEAIFGEPAPADIWSTNAIPKLAEPIYYSYNIFFEPGNKWRYALLILPIVFIGLIYDQPNPYKLSGPHFLVFYAILMGVVALIVLLSVIAQKNKLAAIFKVNYPGLSKYEMAFLTGGEYRFALLLIAELVDKRVLSLIERNVYIINYDVLKNIDSPLKGYLLESGADKIFLSQLKMVSAKMGAEYRMKYFSLIFQFEKFTNSWLPLIIPWVLGIIRIIQGLQNDKPVGFLLAITIFMPLWTIIMMYVVNFHACCTWIFRRDKLFFTSESDNYSRGIIISGISFITYGSIYSHLLWESWRAPNSITYSNGSSGDGSSCGGGGCSGGGGCGGGCGGCGGD